MIRRLKKKAEVLEASFGAKAEYLEVSLLALFYLLQYLVATLVAFKKGYPSLIQIFDLTVLGRVPFMYFQCTQLIMPSRAVHHDTARREYLLGLLLVLSYVFVFWSKARRWNKKLDFEIGFSHSKHCICIRGHKKQIWRHFAGFYGICFEGYLFYLFFFFLNTESCLSLN